MDKLHKDMKRKGIKEDVAKHMGGVFALIEEQIKQIQANVEQQQQQLKEARTNADVSKCNAANFQKTIQAESKIIHDW